MKVRNGFVSNSSSSSFIIATDKKGSKNSIPLEIKVEIDLKKYIDESISTIKELKQYFDYEGYDTDNLPEAYKLAEEAINAGKIVHMGGFSSDGDPLESFLCDNGIPKLSKTDLEKTGIEIIMSDGGY